MLFSEGRSGGPPGSIYLVMSRVRACRVGSGGDQDKVR